MTPLHGCTWHQKAQPARSPRSPSGILGGAVAAMGAGAEIVLVPPQATRSLECNARRICALLPLGCCRDSLGEGSRYHSIPITLVGMVLQPLFHFR